MSGIELAVHDVAGHHHIDLAGDDQSAERLELGSGPCLRHVGDPEIGVGRRAADPREVLERRPHAGRPMRVDLDRRLRLDDVRVGRERPIERADRGAVRVDVEIDHGREVQVEAVRREGCRDRRRPGARHARRRLPDRRFRRDGRKAMARAEPGSGSHGSQVPGQPLDLGRREDVPAGAGELIAVEQDDAAEPGLGKGGPDPGRIGEDASAEADDHQPRDLVAETDRGRRWRRRRGRRRQDGRRRGRTGRPRRIARRIRRAGRRRRPGRSGRPARS